jgi:hypothetical protein
VTVLLFQKAGQGLMRTFHACYQDTRRADHIARQGRRVALPLACDDQVSRGQAHGRKRPAGTAATRPDLCRNQGYAPLRSRTWQQLATRHGAILPAVDGKSGSSLNVRKNALPGSWAPTTSGCF